MALSGKREAFRVDNVARGLDHQRTTYLTANGHWVANSATTFEAGQLVALNAAGEIVAHTGTDTKPLGIVKYNKDTAFNASVAGEAVVVPAAGATVSLAHSNLVSYAGAVGGIRVATAVTGGTVYTEGVADDYTLNYATGALTNVVGGTMVVGATVYVNYQYAMTARELLDDGANFWNSSDDVTIQGDKVTIIEGPATIYTTQFNASRPWAINDDVSPGQQAADGCAAIFDRTASSTNTTVIGKVIQLPTASDPFIGIQYYG